MYAVVKLGSHQYRVAPGQTIDVEKLDGPVGSDVRFKDVLFVSDGENVKLGTEAQKTSVVGTITAQNRGQKIHVFKKIRRKGFRKLIGHRQQYTQVEIKKIGA